MKTSAKTSTITMSNQSSAKPKPFVKVPRLTCVNHNDGKLTPIQRAGPESDEKGTSSPEKFMPITTVRILDVKIAAT